MPSWGTNVHSVPLYTDKLHNKYTGMPGRPHGSWVHQMKTLFSGLMVFLRRFERQA